MRFSDEDLFDRLIQASTEDLDRLPFGVIGFDRALICTAYNAFEAEKSGLSPERVLGRPFFERVAPCMNNYLVADRLRQDHSLDETLPYVLSVRVVPTEADLRLLVRAGEPRRFLAIDWGSAS